MNFLTENTKIILKRVSGEIKKQHTKQWLIIGLATIVLLILIVVIYSFLAHSYIKHSSVSKKTYADQLHYVTITVPQNWQTDQEDGSNISGLNTSHPISQTIEISQYYLSTDQGITIQVYQGKPMCPLDESLNTNFDGFPAAYNAFLNTWTIPTTKATITISIAYPGSNMVHTSVSQTKATPVPSILVEQNRKYIMGILNTVKLKNLAPFNCQ